MDQTVPPIQTVERFHFWMQNGSKVPHGCPAYTNSFPRGDLEAVTFSQLCHCPSHKAILTPSPFFNTCLSALPPRPYCRCHPHNCLCPSGVSLPLHQGHTEHAGDLCGADLLPLQWEMDVPMEKMPNYSSCKRLSHLPHVHTYDSLLVKPLLSLVTTCRLLYRINSCTTVFIPQCVYLTRAVDYVRRLLALHPLSNFSSDFQRLYWKLVAFITKCTDSS
ncbi:hypothetical protein AB205_0176240 [Aquarana catesbeiana]|uniref:Uncharacterized protein n=1 Tax=Aquarana catesbeiana TaxID=8400 RepID=A0A2G9P0X5_AQUCT|nr:hypothetical protein AB205_0176240 [Aquarana catesbeiana]